MTADKPRAPSGLESAGRSLWRRMTGAYGFDVWEQVVLEAACRQADDIAQLQETIATVGMTGIGSTGQPRLSQAVTEVRQGRLALARLLDQLNLPSEAQAGSQPGVNGRQRRAHRAAEARWGPVRALRKDGA